MQWNIIRLVIKCLFRKNRSLCLQTLLRAYSDWNWLRHPFFHAWFTSMSGFSSSMQTTNTQLSESYRAKLRDRFARGQFLSSIVSVARIADLAHESRLEYTIFILPHIDFWIIGSVARIGMQKSSGHKGVIFGGHLGWILVDTFSAF